MTPMYNYPTAYPNLYQVKQPDPNNGIIWVQGIEGAKAFQMMPNSNIQLMDSENDGVFYIKVTDNIGMATLRVFHYTEITNQDMIKKDLTGIDLTEYVKKSELQDLIAEFVNGKEKVNEQPLSANKTSKPKPLIQG